MATGAAAGFAVGGTQAAHTTEARPAAWGPIRVLAPGRSALAGEDAGCSPRVYSKFAPLVATPTAPTANWTPLRLNYRPDSCENSSKTPRQEPAEAGEIRRRGS